MGCAQPRTMARSMSSAVAWPDSAIRMAESRYGTSRALTTAPARSAECTTCLPRTCSANVSARSRTAAPVSGVLTSSTSGSTGTGLKKCMPSTRSGRAVHPARVATGTAEVLVANTAPGSVTISSSCRKTADLAASSSATASITSWRSQKSPGSVVKRRRRAACSRSRSVILPEDTPRSRDCRIRERPAVVSSRVDSHTRTSTWARAQTSAMPEPICPAPTTPTRVIRPASVAASRLLLMASWVLREEGREGARRPVRRSAAG